MGADERVPVAALCTLNPCHIHLHKRGSAPLTCLEHNQPQRSTGKALLFEHPKHATLRTIKHEWHIAPRELVLNLDAFGSPVLKVVERAQFHPSHGIARRGNVAAVVEHGLRHQFRQMRVGTVNLTAHAEATDTSNRVVIDNATAVATHVLAQDFVNIYVSHH